MSMYRLPFPNIRRGIRSTENIKCGYFTFFFRRGRLRNESKFKTRVYSQYVAQLKSCFVNWVLVVFVVVVVALTPFCLLLFIVKTVLLFTTFSSPASILSKHRQVFHLCNIKKRQNDFKTSYTIFNISRCIPEEFVFVYHMQY